MRPFFTSSSGIEYRWVDDGDKKVIVASQDATPILDAAKAQATANDGYSADRSLRRVATIPAIVRLKWLYEEGWDCFATHDPDVVKRLKAKLNSSEYAFLRTAPGRV